MNTNTKIKQTDLSIRLREAATGGKLASSNVSNFLLHGAADEIERYYGGMLNWKATAEAKDATIAELRAALEAAQPAAQQGADDKPDGWDEANETARRLHQQGSDCVALVADEPSASQQVKALLAQQVERDRCTLSDAELADPEFVRAYIEGQNESFSSMMAELVKTRTALAQIAGSDAQPFMFSIMGPDGKAFFDEHSVAPTPEALYDGVNALNDSPDAGYSVVPVYTTPQPAVQGQSALLQALHDIANPIEAMRREVPDGYCFEGGMALHMANDPEWYKRRAQAAIDAHPVVTAVQGQLDSGRDAALLDFVIENDAFLVWSLRDGSIRQCQLMNQDEDEEYHCLSGEDRYFNTPREAIDAARAAQPVKPSTPDAGGVRDLSALGYVVGATVEQDCGTLAGKQYAVITYVHPNGALDVESDGIAYGWSSRLCKPVKGGA